MKRFFLTIVITFLFFAPAPSAFPDPVSEYNATITGDEVFLMEEPSFVSRDFGIFGIGVGNKIIVLSRTSFTDLMAGVPEDYWYLILERHCGAEITGYVHGSALKIDPDVSIPVFDPPGAAPTKAYTAFERCAIEVSIDETCVKTTGALTVPPGIKAVRFRLIRFSSGYTSCPGDFSGQIIAFSIAPASDPGNPSFTYEEPDGGVPDVDNAVRGEFFSLDLPPGTYLVDIEGRPWINLKITYDLVEAP